MLKTLLRAGVAAGLAFTLQAQTAPQPAPQPAPAAPAAATQQVQAKPALWVVRDADTTIYMFGTVHVLKPGISWFNGPVKTAFDASSELVVEMVPPEPQAMQQLALRLGMSPTGPTLSEKLSAERRTLLAATATNLGLPIQAVDRMDPWFAALNIGVIAIMRAGYDPNAGVEPALLAAARAANKSVSGLETPEQQLGFFDTLPEPVQISYLGETLDQVGQGAGLLDAIVASWSAGDPVRLADQMNESMRATPEVGKVLLADRNVRWAEWIKQRLARPGTVFMAVGAGHLAGADSVQAQLGRHNLSASRVQ